MPELPEVETAKEGIKPYLEGQTISEVIVRNARLRLPVPPNMTECCVDKKIISINRRAKYLLIQLSSGYILIHLGMSGHLRIISRDSSPEKHDHVDLILGSNLALRYCDPRRFGLFLYLEGNPEQHSLLRHLGPEPLSDDFNCDYLYRKIKNKNQAIKSLIMTNEVVVGVGNIYATESLFFAGIHPLTPAKKLSRDACKSLSIEIKRILQLAIEAGGTTLKDFYASDGKPGYFNFSLQIYGRKNQTCFQCHNQIEAVIIGGRQSAYCPDCQPLAKTPIYI